MVRDLWDCGLVRAWRTLRLLREEPEDDRLAAVRCPALVVRGTKDLYVSRAWAAHVARLLPRGRLVEVVGGDHTLNFTAPDRLEGIVAPFAIGAAAAAARPEAPRPAVGAPSSVEGVALRAP